MRSGPLSVVPPGRRQPEMVLLLWCGLNKPVFEAGVEGKGVRAGEEGALLKEDTRVASLGVGNDLARVSSNAQTLADQLIESELLRSGDLDGSVDGLANSGACNRAGDRVSGDGLDERVGEARSAMLLTNSKNWVACTIE
jgi:hypothetical protein